MNIQKLKLLINYNPLTGEFTARSATPVKMIYSPAAGVIINIGGERYRGGPVAWALHYNEQPPSKICRRNGNILDNKIDNLYGPKKKYEPKPVSQLAKWSRSGYKPEGNHLVKKEKSGNKLYLLMYKKNILNNNKQ